MSFSDPFIKEVKRNVYHLTINQPVTDSHPNLQPFCEQLEILLRRGLKQSLSIFETSVRDYWKCFEAFAQYLSSNRIRCHPFFEISVNEVRSSAKVTSDQGRGRCFLRHSLQNKFLDNIIELLAANVSFLNNWYHAKNCLLFDHIQTEIFLSILKQINEVTFELCLRNGSFLDHTWTIPIFKTITLVPCKNLGMEILHKNGYSIVLALCKLSVAAESGEIESGDILDEVYGRPLRNITVGTISSFMKQFKHRPIDIAIVKGSLTDGSAFRPIYELVQNLPVNLTRQGKDAKLFRETSREIQKNRKPPPHALLPEDDAEEIPVHNESDRAQYSVQYLGFTEVGPNGSVSQIEQAIDKVICCEDNNENYPSQVQMSLGETEVIILKLNSELCLKACYTEISACGRKNDASDVFSCIIGETTCTLARNFVAHVFKARNCRDARVILCTIAQGFERTHWFV